MMMMMMMMMMTLFCTYTQASSLSSDSQAPLSKLDRVKMFVELLIKTIRSEDMLAIVTFGTTARVVLPLRRMSDDDKVHVSVYRAGINAF